MYKSCAQKQIAEFKKILSLPGQEKLRGILSYLKASGSNLANYLGIEINIFDLRKLVAIDAENKLFSNITYDIYAPRLKLIKSSNKKELILEPVLHKNRDCEVVSAKDLSAHLGFFFDGVYEFEKQGLDPYWPGK